MTHGSKAGYDLRHKTVSTFQFRVSSQVCPCSNPKLGTPTYFFRERQKELTPK